MYERPAIMERRRRARVALHWQLTLLRKGEGHEIRSETKNISSEGFYCLCDEAVTPGERLDCVILTPLRAGPESPDVLRLYCRVKVARVELSSDGQKYGIGFRIEDYSVVDSVHQPLAAASRIQCPMVLTVRSSSQ